MAETSDEQSKIRIVAVDKYEEMPMKIGEKIQRAIAIGLSRPTQDCIATVFAKEFPSDVFSEIAEDTCIEAVADE